MKKLYLLIFLFIIFFKGFSQETVNIYSRSNVSNNWLDSSNPWYRSCDSWNLDRPDKNTCNNWSNIGSNSTNGNISTNVFIGHNNNLTMTINWAFFQLRTLTIEASCSSNRSFTADATGGISLYTGLYNRSTTATHTFTTPIGIDGSTVIFENTSGGFLSFNSNIYTNNNTLEFNGDKFTVNGIIGGGSISSIGKLKKSNSGTLVLTAQNTYTGLTTVGGGTLQLNRTGGNTIPNTNNVTVSEGAILKISTNQTLNDLTLNGSGALQIDDGATLTIKGTLSAVSTSNFNLNYSGNLVIDSGATLNISGSYSDTSGRIILNNNANLLQNAATTNNANTGSIIVNKNSASIQLYDYTLWSSPVAGQNLKTFSQNTLNSRFYSYDSSQNLYSAVNPLTTAFATATGYLIRAPNSWTASTPTTFNGAFTGVPNNGTITLSGLTANSFYAVGNPYPSSISATSFINGNTTGGTLYFWRKTNGANGSAYATRTNAGGTASGGLTPTDDIGVGQGFIVKTGASATTLSFNNTMRTSSNSLVFLRTNEERNRYWLNLNTPTEFICQTLVAYMPEATASFDNAIDGKYINDAPVALTSLINSEEYTIQGRALPFSTTDSVLLGFKTNVAGNYTISIDHVDGFFSTGQAIFLKDNLLNTVNDLSAGSYSFASAVGTFNSRFEIVYQRVLGVNNPEFTSNNVVVFNDKGDIRINSGSAVMEQVRIYDLQGRLLVDKKQINTTETKITTTAANQVLLIEITALNGQKVTKKIIQ